MVQPAVFGRQEEQIQNTDICTGEHTSGHTYPMPVKLDCFQFHFNTVNQLNFAAVLAIFG